MSCPTGTWLAVGRIRRPHGVHGDVVADVETDFPERVAAGTRLAIGLVEPERFLDVHQVRWHKGAWLLSFVGLRSLEEVEPLRGHWLFLPERPRSELPEHYYYEHELIGCRCVAPGGTALGQVVALTPGGSGMLLEVHTADAREVLVPFVSPLVVGVDLASRTIVLDPPEGLFSGDAL